MGFLACFSFSTPTLWVFPLAFLPKTHDMCFSPYISSHTHTFLPGTHQPASVLCFPACFSLQKHTTCVFLLTFPLVHTLFSPAHTNQLPFCVFRLAFLSKNTRHVFFCLLFLSYTHFSSHDQFSPRNLSISFRGRGFPLANFSPHP